MSPAAPRPLEACHTKRAEAWLLQVLIRAEHSPEILEHPNGIRRLRDLREAVAREFHARQIFNQRSPGILFEEQIAHVHLADLIAQQAEVRVESAVEQIRLVRVPAGL